MADDPTTAFDYDPIQNPNPWVYDDGSPFTMPCNPRLSGPGHHAGFAGSDHDYNVQQVAAALISIGSSHEQKDLDYWTINIESVSHFPRFGTHWWSRLVGTFDYGSGAGGAGGGLGGTIGGGANGALVNKQLGLLEDDIIYRLSLLAVNVLQPLKTQYPNIVIVSGLRQVNTGIGQHEQGEAVDLQITNQTPMQLYIVADYIQKYLNFDQLVLNWTDIGDGQGWIHVSFSPDSLRGQVLTKDLADGFHTGLFLCTPLTGEDAAAALRDQATSDAAIITQLTTTQARQQRLGIYAANTSTAGSGGGGAAGTDGPPQTLPLVGGPNGVQFDHDWTGKIESQLRTFLDSGMAGPDGSDGQKVIDAMNALGSPFAGGEFQLRHNRTGFRTYGFSHFYVSYIRLGDGTGQYQIVQFGATPAGN